VRGKNVGFFTWQKLSKLEAERRKLTKMFKILIFLFFLESNKYRYSTFKQLPKLAIEILTFIPSLTLFNFSSNTRTQNSEKGY
jgi:hypothetical protein